MKSLQRFSQFLGIRSGEHSRFGWLFAHSLFNGICTAFLFSAAYALFLDNYDARHLPWAYIASALVGYAVVAVFSRLERELTFKKLLRYQLYFVLVFIMTFWLAERAGSASWPVFLMFISMSPLLTLLELEYWGIAFRLFDLRQGKRLFTLVTVGGVLSSIAGFFLVPVMVSAGIVRELEDLLLFAAVGVAFSLMAVSAIQGRFGEQLEIKSAEDRERRRGNLRTLSRDRYFVLISALVIAFTLVFYLVDLSFLAEVEIQYSQGAELAAFVGQFYGLIKILELLFKTFAGGRLVSRHGVGFGLTTLPAVLLVTVAVAAAVGQPGAGGDLFFLAVAATKLVWLVLRKAIFDGAFKVLYQPLDVAERFAFQARIEGTVSPAMTLLVGVGLLLYGRDGFATLDLVYALLPLLAVWIAVALLLYREYRNRLLKALSREGEKGGVESPVEAIRKRLLEAQPPHFDYIAGVLERVDATALPPALIEIARQGAPELMTPVLHRIERRYDFDALEAVELCVEAEDPHVRSAARKTMRSLRDVVKLASGEQRIAELIASPEPADRALAALALGWSASHRPGDLTGLMWDRDPAVRRAALRAAGRLRDPRFWPRLVSHLSSPQYAATAATALISIGAPVLPELESAFDKVGQETDVRLRILGVLEHLGGARPRELIGGLLRFPDRAVRHRALVSLSHSGYHLGEDEVPAIKNQIEALIATMHWNLTAILDLGEAPQTLEVCDALEDENARRREELLFLLSLLFDSRAVRLVKENLDSGEKDSMVYALEILDVVVSADIKPMLFPVLESMSPAKAVRRLDSFFPRQRSSRLERLGAITFREHDAMSAWSRACALLAIAELSHGRAHEVLIAHLFHPEPMLQEVAAACLLEIDRKEYDRHTGKLSRAARERLGRVLMPGHPDVSSWRRRSMYGRVSALRRVRGFEILPWRALMSIAVEAEELEIETGQSFPPAGEPEGALYAVIEGRLGSYTEAGGMGVLGAGTLIAFADTLPPCRVLETGRAFRLAADRVYELTVAHADLVPALLAAVSPHAEQEIVSLSRSFESVISFAPSH